MGCLKLTYRPTLKLIARTEKPERSREAKGCAGAYQYKYQGQELQDELGLNWYSFKWRNYDPGIGRFMSVDPLSEKYVDWGPYVFSGNRVIDARELEGLEPHILFNTRDKAAKNFGQQYNGKSIIQGREYAATIYSRKMTDGRVLYAYNNPRKGTNDGATVPEDIPKGTSPDAIIHSHGKYEANYDNNNFSGEEGDIGYAESKGMDIYVTTPDGSLKIYDVNSNTETVLSTDIQSDPNDPDRKNKIDPVENPKPVETKPKNENKKENDPIWLQGLQEFNSTGLKW